MTTISFNELQRQRAISHLGLDPFPWYKQMRMTNPVAFDEENTLYEVFRYKDVQAVLLDSTHFSVKGTLGEEGADFGSIASQDPPRHNELRALVSQAFTPRTIAQQADNIHKIANELLDACASSDTLELVHDFAIPFPMRVIADLLGVPVTRQDDMKRWTMAMIGHSLDDATAGFFAFVNYMQELIEEKRKERQDDLVSALLDAELNGEFLSKEELVKFCVSLLGAGFETSTHLFGNILLCLDEYPEAREQVWADPSLAPGMIEEVLRFRPVAPRLARVVKGDTEIGGKTLKTGHFVFVWTGSANRDEEQWKDPEVFDIRRSPNLHLGLGYGIHVCLGAPLIRLETRIALEQFIERFKDVRIVRETPLQLVPSHAMYGMQQLPLRVQRR